MATGGGMIEDRRTALAVFLCIVVVMVYVQVVLEPRRTSYQQPQQPAVTQQQQVGGQAPVTVPATTSSTQVQAPLVAQPIAQQDATAVSPPTAEELKDAGSIVVASSSYRARISLLGGRLMHYRLLQHRIDLEHEKALDLVSSNPGMFLPLGVYAAQANDARVHYRLLQAEGDTAPELIALSGNEEVSVTLEGQFPNGATIQKRFTFTGNSHLFNLDVSLQPAAAFRTPVWIEWAKHVPTSELGGTYDPKGFAILNTNNKIDTHLFSEFEDGSAPPPDSDGIWISNGDKYFMASLISLDGPHATHMHRDGEVFVSRIAGKPDGARLKIYTGPKEYEALKKFGYELHRNVDLGIFSFLAHPLIALIRMFYGFLGNYGLAIILLTLLIKALFLPLTSASFKSMKAMQDLQPEIKALRERVKDPTQLNQEMMGLYKKRGVNPMGGCLPMLIQLPVFLGLYNGLLYSTELRHAPFALWITDLSAPEKLEMFGIGVPIMVLLMGASMFLQQLTTPSAMDPQQKKIMLMMPVVFTIMFIVIPFPAGLVLYWLVNNLISIVQQGFLRSERDFSPLKATAVASVGLFCFGYVLTLF